MRKKEPTNKGGDFLKMISERKIAFNIERGFQLIGRTVRRPWSNSSSDSRYVELHDFDSSSEPKVLTD